MNKLIEVYCTDVENIMTDWCFFQYCDFLNGELLLRKFQTLYSGKIHIQWQARIGSVYMQYAVRFQVYITINKFFLYITTRSLEVMGQFCSTEPSCFLSICFLPTKYQQHFTHSNDYSSQNTTANVQKYLRIFKIFTIEKVPHNLKKSLFLGDAVPLRIMLKMILIFKRNQHSSNCFVINQFLICQQNIYEGEYI